MKLVAKLICIAALKAKPILKGKQSGELLWKVFVKIFIIHF
jgi:hypothetical protein